MIDAGLELEYSKKFWDLANVVTGFALVQVIAYVLSVGSTESKIREGVIYYHRFVKIALWVGAAIYCAVVILLCIFQLDLLAEHADRLQVKMWVIAGARVLAILLVTSLGHWVTQTVQPVTTPPDRT